MEIERKWMPDTIPEEIKGISGKEIVQGYLCTDPVVRIRKEGEKQFIAVLNNPDRKKIICDCLTEITGQECMFSAIEKDSAVVNDNSDDAYLETLYDTFGKEPVNVVDQIK